MKKFWRWVDMIVCDHGNILSNDTIPFKMVKTANFVMHVLPQQNCAEQPRNAK